MAGLPSMRQADFPSAVISRLMSTPSSSGGYPASPSAAAAAGESPVKRAEMTAFSSPVRMISLEVRSPSTALMALIRIVFPAPVSPVKTLRPPVKSIAASLITAIFFM